MKIQIVCMATLCLKTSLTDAAECAIDQANAVLGALNAGKLQHTSEGLIFTAADGMFHPCEGEGPDLRFADHTLGEIEPTATSAIPELANTEAHTLETTTEPTTTTLNEEQMRAMRRGKHHNRQKNQQESMLDRLNDHALMHAYKLLMHARVETKIEKAYVKAMMKKYQEVKFLPANVRAAIIKLLTRSPHQKEVDCVEGSCSATPVILESIWQYGCWCDFEEHLSGTGVPVNTYDLHCKNLQLCLRCANHDAQDAGETCDPETQRYHIDVEKMFSMQARSTDAVISSTCSSLNDNACAINLCMCEMELIRSLIETAYAGHNTDIHVYGHHVFDHSEHCLATAGVVSAGSAHIGIPMGISMDANYEEIDESSDRMLVGADADGEVTFGSSCCGKYPKRYPFAQGHMGCCNYGNEPDVYNVMLEACCEGVGVVAGTCA